MDERHRLLLTLLAGGGFGAVLGSVFGAVVGAVTARDGRAAGTGLAQRVARLWSETLSPEARGALVGAVDGFIFLGTVGIVLTGLAGWQGPVTLDTLRPAWLAAGALALGATLFGLLAFAIVRGGLRSVAAVFIGGMLGALAGAGLRGADGLLSGALTGMFAAALAMSAAS